MADRADPKIDSVLAALNRSIGDDRASAVRIVRDRGERLRVGVVGCGYWGSKHVRVLCSSPDVAGVAVIDPDPRASERIRSAFPMVRTFPELLPALRHVDALVVATPPRTHGVLALEALRHGK